MNYWLDLYTCTTWQEFQDAGASVTGFRQRRAKTVARIQAGDVLLCYLTYVMRWVGALEVLGPSKDTRPTIWQGIEFPLRLSVKPLVMLSPEHGVPMDKLNGKVAFFTGDEDAGKFKGFIRGTPTLFKRPADGELIMGLLRDAERETGPGLPVDPRIRERIPLFKVDGRVAGKKVETWVSVPETEHEDANISTTPAAENVVATRPHTEIQYLLLKLGADMGLDLWVAKNDRSSVFNGQIFGEMPRMVQELPAQFTGATQRTIELIDVLWLKGNSIVAAFEVESTTSIYSGLLRMGDLLALQPNLDMRLYLVAPEERRDKVRQEITRPTFNVGRDKPLHTTCKFLSFRSLQEKLDAINKLKMANSLKPDFLWNTAESFT